MQYASFQEAFCPGCKLYFLGGWSYKKNVGEDGKKTYGRRCDVKYLGGEDNNDIFVIPRDKSIYAVELSLLKFLSDELHHSRGSMESAVRVWSGQHCEEHQRAAMLGTDLTLFGNTWEHLSTA